MYIVGRYKRKPIELSDAVSLAHSGQCFSKRLSVGWVFESVSCVWVSSVWVAPVPGWDLGLTQLIYRVCGHTYTRTCVHRPSAHTLGIRAPQPGRFHFTPPFIDAHRPSARHSRPFY